MKKTSILYIMILSAIIGLNSGCATYIAKKHWDQAREQKSIRIEADGSHVLVGVDLLSLDYLQDNWKIAIPAAIVDGIIIYQGYKWIDDTLSDNDSSNQRNNSVNISGNSESSISVNIGGDTSTRTDSVNNDSLNNFN
jgi:hypothetical protein